jgi:hypothetical protein
MYKKLMFLISLVSLLALANVVSAETFEWTGNGDGTSWDDPLNWDPNNEYPGQVGDGNSAQIQAPPGQGPIADVTVGLYSLRGPGYDGDAGTENIMAIVGGTITCRWWRVGWNDGGRGTLNWSGGTVNITDSGSSFRVCDNGSPPEVNFNMSGTAVLNANGRWRNGDEGGVVNIDMSGDCVANIASYARIGDDGEGTWTVRGNAELNINDEWYFVGRGYGPVTATIQDNATVNCENLRIGENDDQTCTFNMEGGTVTVEETVYVGYYEGDGVLNATGGLIVCDELEVTNGREGVANIDGGTIECCHLRLRDDGLINLISGTIEVTCDGSLNCDGGVINITGGTLILAGDQCDAVASAAASGCIAAYYVEVGDCKGARGEVECVYDDVENKTYVTASAADLNKAWDPKPANEAVWQSVNVVLDWCEGDCVARHMIYLGDDAAAVEAAGTGSPEFRGQKNSPGHTWDPDGEGSNQITLALWQTYYWRIDEGNSRTKCPTAPPVTKGDVWSFTTGCDLIAGDINLDCLVNFLDYAMVADDWRVEVWFPDDVPPAP